MLSSVSVNTGDARECFRGVADIISEASNAQRTELYSIRLSGTTIFLV